MKLAISNIAWTAEQDHQAAELMGQYGVTGVEIAPSRVWPIPVEASDEDVMAHRRFWEDCGIRVAAMQALLYGHPELTIFGNARSQGETGDYLRKIMRLAGLLGAGPLVFGSPRNRRVGNLSAGDARAAAVRFFREMGEAAEAEGVTLCIEANPPQYDCDFVTTTVEAMSLVRDVDHPGFGLHLDTGGMALNKENVPDTLRGCAGAIRHVHASEPFLAQVGPGVVAHEVVAASLREIGYDGWVSVEMRRNDDRPLDETLHTTLSVLRDTYGA
jgi:sugar phosphate isomerase/epimerase